MFGFNLTKFAEEIGELAKNNARVTVSNLLDTLCAVDVIEAGHELEGTHLADADNIFDLTVGDLHNMLQAA